MEKYFTLGGYRMYNELQVSLQIKMKRMHVFISFLKYCETLCIRGMHEIVLRVIVDRGCIEKVYLKKER